MTDAGRIRRIESDKASTRNAAMRRSVVWEEESELICAETLVPRRRKNAGKVSYEQPRTQDLFAAGAGPGGLRGRRAAGVVRAEVVALRRDQARRGPRGRRHDQRPWRRDRQSPPQRPR